MRHDLLPPLKMTDSIPMHPVDALTAQEKCDIYFSRVVDLAVAFGLLIADPDTEIGHFAFSRHYTLGKDLDGRLQRALHEFEEKYPERVLERREIQNKEFLGAADEFFASSDQEKMRDLILIGASRRVWPTGTSFVLTYPWDPVGNGQRVVFRPDLTDFTKRRILAILRKAGKLRDPNPFM